jgi:hypothetical protein
LEGYVDVMPVREPEIQGFENEPHGCGQRKHDKEFPGMLEQERFCSPEKEKGLDENNIAPPGKRIVTGIKRLESEQHGEGGSPKDQAAQRDQGTG